MAQFAPVVGRLPQIPLSTAVTGERFSGGAPEFNGRRPLSVVAPCRVVARFLVRIVWYRVFTYRVKD